MAANGSDESITPVYRLKQRPVSKRFTLPEPLLQRSLPTITQRSIWSKCLLRNSFHVVFRLRSGDGSIPCCFRILAIVLCASTWPRLASAPWMRRYPQDRFSSAMRMTSVVISVAVCSRVLAFGINCHRPSSRSFFDAKSTASQESQLSRPD